MYNKVQIPQDSMKILEMATTDYINMSMNDAVNSLSALFKSSKRMRDISHIASHTGFVRLCEILNRDIRLMKMQDVVESLKVLTYFQTQSNSFLIQSLLQIIRTNINEMSLHDIIFTVFLLNKMQSTPLRDALLIALPLVFEIQLPTKLDSSDMVLLAWSLRFAYEYNIQNPDVHDIILKSLWKFENNLDAQVAKSIFYSLCHMPQLSPTACKLLCNVRDVLTSKAKELNVYDITKILETLVVAVIKYVI